MGPELRFNSQAMFGFQWKIRKSKTPYASLLNVLLYPLAPAHAAKHYDFGYFDMTQYRSGSSTKLRTGLRLLIIGLLDLPLLIHSEGSQAICLAVLRLRTSWK